MELVKIMTIEISFERNIQQIDFVFIFGLIIIIIIKIIPILHYNFYTFKMKNNSMWSVNLNRTILDDE